MLGSGGTSPHAAKRAKNHRVHRCGKLTERARRASLNGLTFITDHPKKILMAPKTFWVTLVQVIFVASLAIAQTNTMKKGQLMAADKATLKMAQSMAFENDYQAMAELMYKGRLLISDGGEQVSYVKVHPLSGMIEVRKRGSAKVWWIGISAIEKDNPTLAAQKPEELKYDHSATEAQYLKEMTDILAKNKNLQKQSKNPAADAAEQAQKLIDRGKKLEEEGDVGDVQFWRAAKIWLQMGLSPRKAAQLMPVFADTLIGTDLKVGDHDLPGLMGDAIAGKKPALDKLRINVGNLRKFQSRKQDDRLAQVTLALEKRYKGANARSKAEGEA